jgi:hypothetical protein
MDEATGLPAVPPGYFWRVFVERNMFTEHGILRVQLRKRAWYGSRLIQTDSTLADTGLKEDTRYLARLIMRTQKDQIQVGQLIDEVSGDYPPKKLEG